jgi:hypothetical protein
MRIKIWNVQTDLARSRYHERQHHLVHAQTAAEAVNKAIRLSQSSSAYQAHDVTKLELVGDAR